MNVVKINANTVIEDEGAALEARFGNRNQAVEQMEGFEGFHLLRHAKR